MARARHRARRRRAACSGGAGRSGTLVADAFRLVEWRWVDRRDPVQPALGRDPRVSPGRRSSTQALPGRHAAVPRTFSAFGVGLLANAVLPGRIGEFARVARADAADAGRRGRDARRCSAPSSRTASSTSCRRSLLIGSRPADGEDPALGDHEPADRRRRSASSSSGSRSSARGMRHDHSHGRPRRRAARARDGAPRARRDAQPVGRAARDRRSRRIGWIWQLLAVYTAMRAFDIHEPLPAAALVLVLMNVATIFPLWPGNVGLVQAAVALPLVALRRPVRPAASRSGSGCRRSRCPSASGSA